MKTIREQFIELGIIKPAQDSYGEGVQGGKPKLQAGPSPKRSTSSKNAPLCFQAKPQASRERKPIQKNQINKKQRRSWSKLICILCGESIPYGDMLKHKEKIHGEKMITQSPIRPNSSSHWVHIVQGGLPGLGKRNR